MAPTSWSHHLTFTQLFAPCILASLLLVSSACSPDSETRAPTTVSTGDQNEAGAGGSMSTPDTPGNNTPNTPDTTTPTPAPGNGDRASGCEPGLYVGNFLGTYRSPADPGTLLALDLIIQSIDTESGHGLELLLEEADGSDDCTLGTEFCADFVVRGGKMRGTANAYLFVNVDFEMDVTGELDCSQGLFQGQLENGWYRTGGTTYHFSGTIQAQYDSATHSFVNGTFEVEEQHDMPPDAPPPPKGWGGEADWDATHRP